MLLVTLHLSLKHHLPQFIGKGIAGISILVSRLCDVKLIGDIIAAIGSHKLDSRPKTSYS